MPALIGNRSHAMAAVDYVRSLDPGSEQAPTDEFRKVGNGAFRTAVLHIASSVIYKVEHGYKGSVAGYDNACEVRNARKLRKQSYPDGYWSTRVRIPKVSAFNVYDMLVVAMEFIDGTLGCDAGDSVSQDAYAELGWLGFSDMHGKNYMVEPDGTLVPIDLASNRYPREYLWPEQIEEARRIQREKRLKARAARERKWKREHAETYARQKEENARWQAAVEAQDRENRLRRVQNKAQGKCSLGCCDVNVPLVTWERELLNG